MKHTVWFVILTYNPDLPLLRQNLSTLANYPVVLVDNTEDETKRKALTREPVRKNVHTLFQEKNIGYAAGMNTGMQYGVREGAEWLVLLNDDMHLGKKGIETFVSQLREKPPGIYGPYGGYLDSKRWTTIFRSPSFAKASGGKRELGAPTSPRLRQGYAWQARLRGTSRSKKNVDYISGSCMAVHKEVLGKLKGFYPDFFMYYEDVDFCKEAKKKGFPVEVLPLPESSHEEGRSIERGSPRHEYYLARNHLLFVERQAPLGIKFREVVRIPKTLWEHHFFMNRAGFRGVLDFLFLRYGKAKI